MIKKKKILKISSKQFLKIKHLNLRLIKKKYKQIMNLYIKGFINLEINKIQIQFNKLEILYLRLVKKVRE